MEFEDVWPNRQRSFDHLREFRPSRFRVFTQALEHIDECLDCYERNDQSGPLARASGIALVKGRNFAVCAVGLLTDGYGQESGALLRLLLEHVELLEYLHRFPQEAVNALNNKLPQAGERAKRIDGKFKFLRDHLNDHSSHGSYSRHSTGHVVNRNGQYNKVPPFKSDVFDVNFRLLVWFVAFLLRSGVWCLEHLNDSDFDRMAIKTDKLFARARHVLEIEGEERLPSENTR